jgi:S1-C subfamily serine protease
MKRFAYPFAGLTLSRCSTRLGLACAMMALLGIAGFSSNRSTAQPAGEHAGARNPVTLIRGATMQVYRLMVEVDGAVKGGTAFLVSGHRIVATNHHVVEKGTAFTLGFAYGEHRIQRVPLKLLAIYPQKDLALLEALDDLPGEPLPLYAGHPFPATDLFAIGFPAAADPQGAMWWASGADDTFFVPSVIKGYVSRVLPNRWFPSQLQHQTPIIPGYSGGPLVDNDGMVVGISTSVHKEANGISYAVLGADLAEFVTACGLPVRGEAVTQNRPLLDQHNPMPAPASVKTAAPQSNQGVATVSERGMMERANRMLAHGDIIAARLILDYLVSYRRVPEAMASLAKSYDPGFLRQNKVLGVAGDAGKAAMLYRQAAELGDVEAKRLLSAITSGSCSASLCNLSNAEGGPQVFCERDRL